MARTTPRVEYAKLIIPTDSATAIAVGSSDWFAWLTKATTFAFVDSSGRFTARKEPGGRADGYWRAYRKHAGKVSIVYLGKSADLTLHRLQDAAATLTGASAPANERAHSTDRAVSEAGLAAPQQSAFPTGTVTFLFAMIDDSATLRNDSSETMHNAPSRVAALLKRVVSARGGMIFEEHNSIVGAAFTNPLDAIAATLDMQRILQAESFEAARPCAVRTALHAGVVQEQTAWYSSHPARQGRLLLAASHGGQILLSQVTQELVRDGLPAQAVLRDLGTYVLGAASHPEHVFQLALSDIITDFPPLRPPAQRPHNLPSRPTPLIGRDQDVAAIVATLHRADVRLITLTGTGGVGKTSLGLQAAADLRDTVADGVFFVDLAALHDAALVLPAIAHALGLADVDNQPLSALLRDYLRDRQVLLLLDNFEQVLPATGTLASLLADAPQIKLLVTSRAPLHLAGEHEFPVAPLPWKNEGRRMNAEQERSGDSAFSVQHSALPPAIALFIQRAQAVRPDFALTPDTAPLIARICQWLNGLPLAIELAAMRIRLFPLAALLQLLDRRLPLLTGGARDMPARHQTLHATIEWSYQLLDERAQTVFQRLAVFEGGFTLHAVEAVYGDQDIWPQTNTETGHSLSPYVPASLSVLDSLTTLVEQSLLYPVEDGVGVARFTMLDTIREYALERLELSRDTRALRHRHLSYYLRLAAQAEPELRGLDRRAWLDRLEADLPNVRAALAWALDQQMIDLAAQLASALGVFWEVRHRREGRDWLAAVLQNGAALEPALRAKALHTAGWLARAQYDYAAGIALLEASMAVYREIGDERGSTAAMTDLGWTLASLGDDMTRASALLAEGLAHYRALGDGRGIARALQGLGWVEQHRALGDGRGMAYSLTGLGWVEQEPGSLAKARALHGESRAIAQAAGDIQAIAWSLLNLGATAAAQRDYGAARIFQEERLAIERTQDNRHGIAATLQQLGMIAFRQGDEAAARAWLLESQELASSIGDKSVAAFALRGLGEVAYAAHDLAEATTLLEQALTHFREIGDLHRMAHISALLAQIALDQQDIPTAQDMARQSIELARSVDHPEAISICLTGLADSAARQGKSLWAARLWGAAERQREMTQARRVPAGLANRAELVKTARMALGEGGFSAAWAIGHALTPDEVIEVHDIPDPALTNGSADTAFGHEAQTRTRPAGLTEREFEVLLLIAQDLSRTQIAERLVISPATVKTHLNAIYRKLGVASRMAAMRYVVDHHLH